MTTLEEFLTTMEAVSSLELHLQTIKRLFRPGKLNSQKLNCGWVISKIELDFFGSTYNEVAVRRNAFGRQIDSFEADLEIAGIDGAPMHAVFIRAPVIEAAGPNVDVIAQLDDGRIVACREGTMLATSFHPELTADTRFHALFASIVSERMRSAVAAEEATA